MDDERRLPGGNAGGAVRVGDTVRRPIGPWTPSVHALLGHLSACGFAGAPQALGIDEDRRRRLELFLASYGWAGALHDFVATVQARVIASANGIGRIGETGDLVYVKMVERGVDADLRTAATELDDFRAHLAT